MENVANQAIGIALLKDPNHWIAAMFLYLTVVDVSRRAAGRTGTPLYDILALSIMGFGGGIVNPVLLGYDRFFPFPMGNDVVVPVIVAAYAVVAVLGSALVDTPGIRHVRLVAFELVRAKLIHGWCMKSSEIIPATRFPYPVFGVLVTGAIGGCGGLFLINGGIGPIKSSVPWAVESAMMASLVHFLFAHSFLSLPGATSEFLGGLEMSAGQSAHLCIAGILVVTRLVPAVRNGIPWRLLGVGSKARNVSPKSKGKKD